VTSAERPVTETEGKLLGFFFVNFFCVTSAERPVTETEGKLLGYIKEWGKKVVLVLNKVCARVCVCACVRMVFSIRCVCVCACVRMVFSIKCVCVCACMRLGRNLCV
jgi:hypothetical protein